MGADVEKAIAYMRSLGRLEHPGACLYYVWLAYAAGGASTSKRATTASEAWGKTLGRHPGDRTPPRGAAVWWGAKPGSSAGDVVISLGSGRVIATDQPRYGVVGEATIDERERLIGRPYLGWSDHIFDAPISLAGLAGETTKPAPKPGAPAQPEEEEDDMPKNFGLIYRAADRREYVLIGNTGSGFETEVSSGPGGSVPQAERESLKTTYDTPVMRMGSAGEAANIKASLAKVRSRTA